MMKKIGLSVIFCLLFSSTILAQTRHEQSGWFMFLNSTKFNEKWGLHFDVQLRSHDDWDNTRNILVRPGITYFIKPNQNATVGYLFTPTFTRIDGTSNTTLTENRVWEQYIISHKVFTGNLSHRFRLEQRFIEKPSGDNVFAQRLRYFFRHVQPLSKSENGFNKGIFAAIQNEVSANIQHKENANNHFFDQNRAYIALGYRFSKKIDVETGYMNVFTKGVNANTVNNVAQLAVYTRF